MTDGPHHGQSATGPAARAADPNTPQVQLHMLAGDHPELRPLIAENPNTYPELLQWLSELGDPAVDAALRRRSAGSVAPGQDQPTTMLPAAGGPARGPSETDEFSAVREDHLHQQDHGHRDPHGQAYPEQHGQGYDPVPSRQGYYPAAPAGPAPWQTPAAPASYAELEPEPRRRGGGTCAILFMILLLAVAAVVAAYFLIFNGVLSGDDSAEESSVSQEQAEEGAPAPEDGTEEEAEGQDPAEDEDEPARPAPEGAQDIPAFTAPSGNINCAMSEDELECSILDYSFETPEDCEGPARLSVGSEDPRLECGSTEGENSATLQYGQSASNGRFACVSSESGFECWNTETGNGFFMARESYQLQN
ncbi:hypothetical protein [Nesterenkonia sandarakina]|uniref:Leucine rich repeat variant domain-containing protein n=1 Tax=Nesterenkonia sandarakina TaxID=272918 RepID=A0A7Z0E9U3_9MICC|nr:hypothetical protein [Nesterenkonia sandarakina]NYJ16997.1 hypothetical protein [Nesterenkonia sandarakina]